MEKRDIVVIFVAVFIVLIMAMYVKPLVTGKEVKLIPDELAVLLQGENRTPSDNFSQVAVPPSRQHRVVPSLTSVGPDTITAHDNRSEVVITGENLTESMNITFFQGSENRTFSARVENGTLRGEKIDLPEGTWLIKIVDSAANITYNTTRYITVLPPVTPVPTWDGRPVPLEVTGRPAAQIFQTRPYPEDPAYNKTPMTVFSHFGGVTDVTTAPVHIPYGYWDLVYTVDFQTHIANPADGKVFEFNRQYKEPLVTYEGEPVVYYSKNAAVPDLIGVKEEVESETVFRHSKDQALTKTPEEDPDASPSYETSTGTAPSSLVETVGYVRPVIKIFLRNEDNPGSLPVVITPPGGIDPLQWDEGRHREEAEKILKQKGKEELLDSAGYTDQWDDAWERIRDPRPWKERIYGPGNYSFIIETQSLDSYNIQVLVPDYANLSPGLPSEDTYAIQEMSIRTLMNSFVRDFNQNIGSDYFASLHSYLPDEIGRSDQFVSIYRSLSQARAAGYRVDDLVMDDILVQGIHATVRGSLQVSNNGHTRMVPLDIPLEFVDGGWKMLSVPDIRT